MANIVYRDQLGAFVCMFITPVTPNNQRVGPGTFVHKDGAPYIVTAAHVAKETNADTKIVMHDGQGGAMVIGFTMVNPTITWDYHPKADIAVCRMDLSSCAALFEKHFAPYSVFDISGDEISRDDELTVVGFPSGLGSMGKFSPLTFRSFAASSFMTLSRADAGTPSDFFCLEQPSMGGYSGGPVLDLGYRVVGSLTSTTGKGTKIKGLIHGTISDDTGGKLALVTPAYYLKDIL